MDDNSKYRDLFFEETDEYLQTLNECLLQLEKDPQDKDVLDEIFRAAHTLKGIAATMGYKTMTDLTHKMESVLELFRSGSDSINSDIISLIFRCLDKLSEIVEDLRTENYIEYDIDDLLNDLSNISETPILNYELSETDKMIIRSAQEDDYVAYNILIDVEEGCLLKGARAYLVINKLEQEGEIIHTDPIVEELEKGEYDDQFKLIYLSKLNKENVKESIEGIAEIRSVLINEIDLDELDVNQNTKIEEQKNERMEKKDHKENHHHVNQSIRVDINKLDSFMNLVSELVIYRTRLEDLNKGNKNTEINEPLEHVARITTELQNLVSKIRMEPINEVFNRFPRMIRDLSRELDKEIELIIEGEETELDRTVVSEIGEPLIHLIRNAADHGIESTDVRLAKGKSKVGLVKLTAYQEGNRVVISISDDGKGINPEAIRESAIRKGIDIQGLNDNDLIQIIFNQGFSTAKEVTKISGRGVGMDVVKQKISSLGGTIDVKSVIDKGTTFVIKLPLTLSIIQALLVGVGSETFAIPLGIIQKVIKLEEDEILTSHNEEIYIYRGKAIPIVRVNERLSIEPNNNQKHIILTLLSDQYYGIIVDNLIGQQEIVIKKLTGILSTMKDYLGATILGNGDVILILDVGSLYVV